MIRERCDLKESMVTKIEKDMIKWFKHMKRMSGSRVVEEIFKANVEGNIGRNGHE